MAGLPSRKCAGVIGCRLLGSSDLVANGLEIRIESSCITTVLSSSNERICNPTFRRRCRFMLLIAAFHRPPKCGALGEIVSHSIPSSETKLPIDFSLPSLFIISCSRIMSFLVPINLRPLSLKSFFWQSSSGSKSFYG